ncbi:hypothetical protein INS49_003353 [Diaporthe citri]|uniref:uncharacterized protein n=1 Tax=Diaporthe citri TaxID=83186 RepID=UPI001C825D51|nr:uncharacterized protein INS49_003353 [Diaporthe citri]KAG6355391.1 hypothetical protein INS49_003353 [Diaporthe citri]
MAPAGWHSITPTGLAANIYGTALAFSILSTIVLALRMVARLEMNQFSLEDYLIVFLWQVFFLSGLVFIKVSICLTLLRIACQPIAATWGEVKGTCLPSTITVSITFIISAFNLITDVTTALLPFLMLKDVQMTKKNKVAIIGILSLRVLASIATIARLPFAHAYFSPTNYLEGIGDIILIAGSLPMLRTLFKSIKGSMQQKSTHNTNSTELLLGERIVITVDHHFGHEPRATPESELRKAVVFADMNTETAKAWSEESKKYASNQEYQTTIFEMNVRDDKSVQAMVDFVVKEFGRLDYAVDNGVHAPIAETDMDDFDSIMNINARGNLCVKAQVAAMLKQEPKTCRVAVTPSWFYKKFVEEEQWVDEQTCQEIFAVCQALPGPASTKMIYCINSMHGRLDDGGFVFRLVESPWSSWDVWTFARDISTVQLAEKAITNKVTRIVVCLGGAAGILYSSLWYFPLLMVAAGLATELRSRRWLVSLLRGVNAAAVGLVYTVLYRLWQIGLLDEARGNGSPLGGDPWWVAITGASFVGGRWFGLSAPLAILLGGVLGMVWHAIVKA